MFKVCMFFDGNWVDMPNCNGLRLLVACEYADIFKRKNGKRDFCVVNEETGEVEYDV